jgi:pyruvate formate lyase activating enzyme
LLDNIIYGFEQTSLIDFPDHVSSVIFLGNCNWRCPTCHNKDIAWYYKDFDPLPFENVFNKIKEASNFIDAITITGGEPTVCSQLISLINKLSTLNLKIKVDTNGSNPVIVNNLINSVSKFAVDFKGPFSYYPYLTGNCITEEEAKDKLTQIFNLADVYPNKFYFRTTLVPCLKNEVKNIELFMEGYEHYFQEYVKPKN